MDNIYTFNLPEKIIREKLSRLRELQVISRIWQKDHTVWNNDPDEISNRLGWLQNHRKMTSEIPGLEQFVKKVRAAGLTRVILLGMGGSSMAPEMFRNIFDVKPGYPDLTVLDTTDPHTIFALEQSLIMKSTLFIVATKSGGTVETLSLMKYFYNKVAEQCGIEAAGKQFAAITDPGSGLEKIAQEFGFLKIFLNDPEIGGRYSALSFFGLVPAALIGVDLEMLLNQAKIMALSAGKEQPSLDKNSAAWLGAVIGASAETGHDKLTFIFPQGLEAFGPWLEQLIAESTGKEGKGILPVEGEDISKPAGFRKDRLFICYRLGGNNSQSEVVKNLRRNGHPIIEIELHDRYSIGGDLFRWMFATAVAGWAIGINPFDQPNVESAKVQTRRFIAAYGEKGVLPSLKPDLESATVTVYSGFETPNLAETWQKFLAHLDTSSYPCSYIAIQAYLPVTPETASALDKLRNALKNKHQVAVTTGYGPRFLHSTGQLHKGDAGKGLFIQLTADSGSELPIPDEPGNGKSMLSFAALINAQAMGDRQALIDAGRKVVRFHLKAEINHSIAALINALN